ncbi:hypothetical protein HY411_03225 [Candidatus Gottesmanbacteria bacterium]|nr:hypothetical protein [Candidatus Gottesmanbacteria bacterium]
MPEWKFGTPHRAIPRIWDALLVTIGNWMRRAPDGDPVLSELQKRANEQRIGSKGVEACRLKTMA